MKYFQGVEIQYEDKSQKRNIEQILSDILTLPKDELRGKRYPNYTGEKASWTLIQAIYSYFVANNPDKKLGDNFYDEIKTDEVQREIRNLLQQLSASP